jgi:glycosyltransferase involved in cell wall biosynthesis
MKIAQVAPLVESVPPKLYGGTERVVSWITEGLVNRGHEVTLFASGDSITSAKLVPIVPRGLRLEEKFLMDIVGFHFMMFEQVMQCSEQFDVVHFHSDYWHLPYLRLMQTPALTTSHARLDYVPLASIYREVPAFPISSISDAQRKPIPWLNWQGTVYHGLPPELYTFNENPDNYILFLGRLCDEKRPDRAIEIARQAKIPLKIAAKVDPADRAYFKNHIEPMLNGDYVEFLGEVDDKQKQDLIGNALALIHPIEFPEPFGIVMIESMACGTPVVAFRTGSIPEVVDEGVTGFVVDDIVSAVDALKKVHKLDRKQIRAVFERRFTSERMADDYLAIYERIILSNKEKALALAK